MKFSRLHFDPPTTGTYLFTDEITLAVNAAIATGRVLLVEGLPGNGKSTLARAIADVLECRYYERTITSRTAARDLLWEFDALERLADAHHGAALKENWAYVQPQLLWWAFAPASAKRRGAPATATVDPLLIDPSPIHADHSDAVLLLDEIDKADPDMPNDLLVPLGESRFEIRESQTPIAKEPARKVLIVVTSNGERALPPAFVRRCARLHLEPRTETDLVDIAHRHELPHTKLHGPIAKWCISERAVAAEAKRRGPSTAEFLDLVRAGGALETGTSGDAWDRLAVFLGSKPAPEDG